MDWALPPHLSSSTSHPSSETASVSLCETISGSHLFKIANYSAQKCIPTGKYISSKNFSVGDHEWAIFCYPNGSGEEYNSSVSVFLRLRGTGKDINTKFNLRLLDQNGKPSLGANYRSSCIFQSLEGWGIGHFIKKYELEASKFLIDDCFIVKCELQVIKASHTENLSKIDYVDVPPSNLQQHFRNLLESGKGADVTFVVAGELFRAHKIVLAAGSPVFDAELFSPMKEGRERTIAIDDMEAEVFRSMLYFIYTDELPKMKDLTDTSIEKETVATIQHLLVAADRYDLKRLRLLCEDKLCKRTDVSTLATTLVLAEQHNCEQLKAICLQSMSDRQTRLAVMASEGFKHLKESCSMLTWDILEKL